MTTNNWMTSNDDIVSSYVETLKTIASHAQRALRRIEEEGSDGGVVRSTTRADLERCTKEAVESLVAVANQVERISVRLDEVIPLQDLRRILENEKLRDSMSSDVRGAWNALSMFLGASTSEIVETEIVEKAS